MELLTDSALFRKASNDRIHQISHEPLINFVSNPRLLARLVALRVRACSPFGHKLWSSMSIYDKSRVRIDSRPTTYVHNSIRDASLACWLLLSSRNREVNNGRMGQAGGSSPLRTTECAPQIHCSDPNFCDRFRSSKASPRPTASPVRTTLIRERAWKEGDWEIGLSWFSPWGLPVPFFPGFFAIF